MTLKPQVAYNWDWGAYFRIFDCNKHLYYYTNLLLNAHYMMENAGRFIWLAQG